MSVIRKASRAMLVLAAVGVTACVFVLTGYAINGVNPFEPDCATESGMCD